MHNDDFDADDCYDDEDQNDLMNLIINYKEGDDSNMAMTNDKLQKLFEEVEVYKQAIQDAKDALASAEMELDAALEAEFSKESAGE